MITTTHAVYNLALLGRRDHPERTWPVLIGALIPDLPGIFCVLFSHFIEGRSFQEIHAVIYFSSFWRSWEDAFHSIPLALLVLGLSALLKWTPGIWLGLSAVLHSLEDIPVHALNPHRHFWPLSGYQFFSPFSCYDPRFHLIAVAMVDFGLACIAAWVIARRGIPKWGKIALAMALCLEAAHSMGALIKG